VQTSLLSSTVPCKRQPVLAIPELDLRFDLVLNQNAADVTDASTKPPNFKQVCTSDRCHQYAGALCTNQPVFLQCQCATTQQACIRLEDPQLHSSSTTAELPYSTKLHQRNWQVHALAYHTTGHKRARAAA
jgi:hypothetical protein